MSGEFKLDFERRARIGLDEALFCESKTVDQISAIVDAAKVKTGRLLLTRLDRSKYEALPARHGARLEFDSLSRTAILGRPHAELRTPPVAIVMAGTSDLPAGREAARTLLFAGQPYREYTDVGVAGLWRLLDRIDEIGSSPVVIVAAGMDAALVSVVGGLIPGAVIALPTSVGYGAARGGETALHAALASCAPGISVVNIDNGYGAACAALRISRALAAAQRAAGSIAWRPCDSLRNMEKNGLKEARERAGMTQGVAASLLGYSFEGYVKIERGKRKLSGEFIRRAAEAFGCNAEEILK